MASAKYTKNSRGYFEAKVWDGTYTESGTKHRKCIRTRKSSAELERLVRVFKDNVNDRNIVKKDYMTFGSYAEYWLKTYKSSSSTNTIKMYSLMLNYMKPINHVPISDVDRIHIQLILNNSDGHQRTKQQLRMTFKQIIDSAVKDKYIPPVVASDIMDGIPKVKYKSSERRPLTESEKAAVFSANYKYEQDKIYTYILYATGMRREEILALTRFDIKDECFVVSKALIFDLQGHPEIKEPKTSNGYRSIPIPNMVLADLKEYLHNIKGPYLFTTQYGEQMTKSGYRRMWNRILGSLQEVCPEKIDGLTAHIFRHNYCTNLCYQIPTVSVKKIAQLMGDTETVVLNVYNHIVLEKENAMDAINAALNI